MSKEKLLDGKVALVTGAAKGIGFEVARTLAENGADIIMSDICPVGDEVKSLLQYGIEVYGKYCNVSDVESVEKLIDFTFERFGRIDILVSNAAVLSRSNSLSDVSKESWCKHLEINLTGTFNIVQKVYKKMMENGEGKIVCIGSIAGKTGGVDAPIDYATTKGGIHAFVKNLSKEAGAKGVYVNGVAPGPIKTDMIDNVEYDIKNIPLNRLGTPKDVANGVLFLVSPLADYITGTILDINGGIY